MEKEELFEKRMIELGKKSYYRGILTFSDFLDLNQQNILHSLSFSDTGIKLKMFGGYESAERQMAAFVPDALSYEQDYPISCIKIEPSASRTIENSGDGEFQFICIQAKANSLEQYGLSDAELC